MTVKRVLVANRGEIAVRVIRACHELGLEAVAVYSEADRNSLAVELADRAVEIGPAPALKSYLDGRRVLEAARDSGADAVHPGYGFLAENADFAAAVMDSGLTWIGPAPETIRLMGDKHAARALAQEAGVPVVPGSERLRPGDAAALEPCAQAVGLPLLVKAAAGGGGIGMRRVDDLDRLEEVVAATQAMAEKAFGSGDVYLERFIPVSRHVEVQVFGFGEEGAIHLFERDCSLQRRFQKVVEESLAPGLPEAVRQKLCECALALCRRVGYHGAGTVEFIVDAESLDFYFLEMNTRIQVEHPVSEMLTGTDLVAMQIDFARGALDAMDQDGIVARGHAIEARLYAENPDKGFLPSPGPLQVFRPPQGLPGVRIDTGYREGDTVTPYYDPLLAKVIVWGETREAARRTAAEALRGFSVDGIRTNRDFLIRCLECEPFARGDVSTRLVQDLTSASKLRA